MPGQPAAFMTYVRFHDQHDDGQLTQFRERLSAEVRVQTGEEFPIFQDRNDIAWGQAWQERIDQTLDAGNPSSSHHHSQLLPQCRMPAEAGHRYCPSQRCCSKPISSRRGQELSGCDDKKHATMGRGIAALAEI